MLCCVERQRSSDCVMGVLEDKILELLDDAACNKNMMEFQKAFNDLIKQSIGECAQCSFLRMPPYGEVIGPDKSSLYCQVIGSTQLPVPIQSGDANLWKTNFISSRGVINPPYITLIPSEFESVVELLYPSNSFTEVYAFPVQSRDSFLGVFCVAFNSDQRHRTTDPSHLKIIAHCVRLTSPFIQMLMTMEYDAKHKEKSDSLLRIAKNMFGELDRVDKLILNIVEEAKKLTHSECCSFFLYDEQRQNLMAQVFDYKDKKLQEIVISANEGIAGYVARTGSILIVPDAYSDPRFYKSLDEKTGFCTRNILAVPVKTSTEVIGVLELCNKLDSPSYSQSDADFALAFASYCALAIAHSKAFRQMCEAQHRSNLANELMMFHMKVPPDDVERLTSCSIPAVSSFHTDFTSFNYTPRRFVKNIDESLLACLAMCEDLNFIKRWNLNRETLARFLLMVQRGYRNLPYHNWMHAFSVAHACYLFLRNITALNNCLSDLERFILFVSCLCHDIDHRGRTNAFQLAQRTVLAQLYSSAGSVMERHHFRFTVAVLNCEGCNILSGLSDAEYTKALDIMQHVILSTDLQTHFQTKDELVKMVQQGYDPHKPEHRRLLLSLLVRSSDISDQTKIWHDSKSVAALVYEEFFSEGDEQREMGLTPNNIMMDRERACIPEVQLDFLNGVLVPMFDWMDKLFPVIKPVPETIGHNIRCWTRMRDFLNIGSLESFSDINSPLDILADPQLEQMVLEDVNKAKFAQILPPRNITNATSRMHADSNGNASPTLRKLTTGGIISNMNSYQVEMERKRSAPAKFHSAQQQSIPIVFAKTGQS